MNNRNPYKMRCYYWAILTEVGHAYNLNPEDLHEMLKVGYKIKTTSTLDFDGWYLYIDNVIYFMMGVFDMYFDVDWRHNEGISWYWLNGTERPDNFNSLF